MRAFSYSFHGKQNFFTFPEHIRFNLDKLPNVRSEMVTEYENVKHGSVRDFINTCCNRYNDYLDCRFISGLFASQNDCNVYIGWYTPYNGPYAQHAWVAIDGIMYDLREIYESRKGLISVLYPKIVWYQRTPSNNLDYIKVADQFDYRAYVIDPKLVQSIFIKS